jgi:hypothetical protein
MTKIRTEKDICALCYDIQDACNFYPVCMELSRSLQDLKIAGVPHEQLYKHPAIIILVDKINDMMLRPDLDTVMKAFTYCREMKNDNQLSPFVKEIIVGS